MARPFNVQLKGFLGLLAAKVQGQAPAEFEPSLRTVLDANPFLTAELSEIWRATTDPVALGFLPAVTPWDALIPVPWLVPQSEIWLIRYLAVTAIVANGSGNQVIAASVLYNRFAASGFVTAVTPPSLPTASGQFATTYRDELVALPGDQVGAMVLQPSTLPTNVITLEMRLIRVPI